jgi:transglutaminase-like putative cysteine protease
MKRALSLRWDFLAALLLLLALLTSAERMVATSWAEGLGITFKMVLLGLILGLAFGYSRFKRTGIYLLTVCYSLTIVPWAIGAAQYPGLAWQESLANLGGRLGVSLNLFFYRQPVEDPILFITFAAVLYWILSLHAAYAFSRKESFVGSILLPGAALFIIQLYDNWVGMRIGLLAFYLFISLLLLGRLLHTRKRREWMEQRVWISSDSNTDLNLTLVLTALVIILLAWIAPSSIQPVAAAKSLWEDITQPLKQTREDLGNAVAGLEHSGEGAATSDFYGDIMALGLKGATGDTVLFVARVPITLGANHYYWRVRTYDNYSANEWRTSSAARRSVTTHRPPIPTTDQSIWPTAEFIFSFPSQSFSILITPPRPVWVSRNATMMYIPLTGNAEEPVLFTVDPIVRPGETYTIHASVANPTEVQLRTAGTEYPTWVTSRYLQLPENFPQSITELARQLADGESNPYDKVNAITNYLRYTIKYNRQVSLAPQGQDPVVWFLFTSKEGFCNYYATAEVLMLRSIGIPARMAVGFAEGEKQNPDRRIVRQKDAHAWPEVYFPGIGWVEFEPTTFISAIVRPSGIVATPYAGTNPAALTPSAANAQTQEAEGGITRPLDETGSGSSAPPNSMLRIVMFLIIIFAFIGLLAFLVFVGLGEKAHRRWQHIIQTPVPVYVSSAFDSLSLPQPAWLGRWLRLAKKGIVEHSFDTVYRSLRWLGAKPDPARTPAQAAVLLASLLPASAADLDQLLNEYQYTLFSANPGDAPTARLAADSVRKLALRAAVTTRLNTVKRFFVRPRTRSRMPANENEISQK